MSKVFRVDKYLWSVRLYKTRSKATEACRTGKVRVNGNTIKPAKALSVNDSITLRKGPVNYSFKVVELLSKRVGAKLVDAYVKDITSKEELEKLEILKLSYSRWREKGAGRPTKKDRREIDDFDDSKSPDLNELEDWDNWEDWKNEDD